MKAEADDLEKAQTENNKEIGKSIGVQIPMNMEGRCVSEPMEARSGASLGVKVEEREKSKLGVDEDQSKLHNQAMQQRFYTKRSELGEKEVKKAYQNAYVQSIQLVLRFQQMLSDQITLKAQLRKKSKSRGNSITSAAVSTVSTQIDNYPINNFQPVPEPIKPQIRSSNQTIPSQMATLRDSMPLCLLKQRKRRTADQISRHYNCPSDSCRKSYGSEGSLNQHIKIKHKEFWDQYQLQSIERRQELIRRIKEPWESEDRARGHSQNSLIGDFSCNQIEGPKSAQEQGDEFCSSDSMLDLNGCTPVEIEQLEQFARDRGVQESGGKDSNCEISETIEQEKAS